MSPGGEIYGCRMLPEARGSGWPALGRRTLLAAGVAGGLAPLTGAPPLLADQALDVQILQTAASIENLAVVTYDAIMPLPAVSGTTATPTLKAILSSARDHHARHAEAYNDAVGKLGGAAQTAPNPGLAQVVSRERGRAVDLGSAVELILAVETAAAQTYQSNVAALADANARRLSASILGVEAQHVAVLLIVRALVANRTPDLVTDASGVLGRLPEDVGRVGFPDSFAKTDQARPPGEGAVR